jgi:hypothetical protein
VLDCIWNAANKVYALKRHYNGGTAEEKDEVCFVIYEIFHCSSTRFLKLVKSFIVTFIEIVGKQFSDNVLRAFFHTHTAIASESEGKGYRERYTRSRKTYWQFIDKGNDKVCSQKVICLIEKNGKREHGLDWKATVIKKVGFQLKVFNCFGSGAQTRGLAIRWWHDHNESRRLIRKGNQLSISTGKYDSPTCHPPELF